MIRTEFVGPTEISKKCVICGKLIPNSLYQQRFGVRNTDDLADRATCAGECRAKFKSLRVSGKQSIHRRRRNDAINR